MRVGRRDALRLAGAAGLGLLGTAGSAAALVQADVLPGRNRRWEDLDPLVPDLSPTHPRGPVEWLRFRSRFRPDVDTNVLVMTPPGTDLAAPAGLPVCFVLHGRGARAHDAFLMRTPGFLADAVAAGVPPFAAVAVDGGSGYWHPRADGTDTMAVLLDDVLPRMAAKGYAAGPDDPFAVVGWSMGGYGALLVGQTVGAPRCAAVGAMSPAIWRTYAATRDLTFDDEADFARHDVVAGAHRLAGVAVRVDCALGEVYLPAVRDLVAAIDPAPEGGFWPGSHNRRFWRRQMPHHLALVGRALGGPGNARAPAEVGR
ncbi:alpha/beta hydrolase-fold protein [Kineosporia sp. R_H_3]|uniref:alpha/beta hydrolase-fold protein n=1 Tax=Kineosporia sp. R_H_3 TaxID=1961848 RepID=UPI000B4B05D0|nr:alpha/beta hydrolase-fold protein [Kineosporia sp. R_H_3]